MVQENDPLVNPPAPSQSPCQRSLPYGLLRGLNGGGVIAIDRVERIDFTDGAEGILGIYRGDGIQGIIRTKLVEGLKIL